MVQLAQNLLQLVWLHNEQKESPSLCWGAEKVYALMGLWLVLSPRNSVQLVWAVNCGSHA